MNALIRWAQEGRQDDHLEGIVNMQADGSWLVITMDDGFTHIFSAHAIAEVVYARPDVPHVR